MSGIPIGTEKKKEDDGEDQELYNLIYKEDWDSALQLLRSDLSQNEEMIARRVGTRRYSPFQAVLRQMEGEMSSPAKALCLRVIEIGGLKMLERTWYGTALHCLLAWQRCEIPLEILDQRSTEPRRCQK